MIHQAFMHYVGEDESLEVPLTALCTMRAHHHMADWKFSLYMQVGRTYWEQTNPATGTAS